MPKDRATSTIKAKEAVELVSEAHRELAKKLNNCKVYRLL